jgi:hypothetical protein
LATFGLLSYLIPTVLGTSVIDLAQSEEDLANFGWAIVQDRTFLGDIACISEVARQECALLWGEVKWSTYVVFHKGTECPLRSATFNLKANWELRSQETLSGSA